MRAVEQEFDNWCQWYLGNKARVVDPKRQWDFTLKALDGLLTITGHLLHEIQVLQHRSLPANAPRILLPDGSSIHGAVERWE